MIVPTVDIYLIQITFTGATICTIATGVLMFGMQITVLAAFT